MRNSHWVLIAGTVMIGMTSMASAQYKYADPSGNINYSDMPPPPNARLLKLNNVPASDSSASPLPFELKQSALNFPVTLYTAAACPSCDEARNYLRNRGIPYAEKTVKSPEDIAVLKQLSPEGTVPVLQVGRNKQIGFATTSWSDALDVAGYPTASKLPRDYHYGDAESAAPTKPTTVVQNKKEAPRNAPSSTPSPGASNAPPGFKF